MRDERNPRLQKLPKVRWRIEVIRSERERGSGLHFSFCINTIIGLIFHFAFFLCSRMGFLAGRQAQLCWERTSRKFQDVPTKRTALGLLTLRRGPTDT